MMRIRQIEPPTRKPGVWLEKASVWLCWVTVFLFFVEVVAQICIVRGK